MIPTPDLTHLTAFDYEHVYEPAEDTFALLDALEIDGPFLRSLKPLVILEIGSGSGCVSAFVGQLLGRKNALYLCTDINQHAVRCTSATGIQNKVPLSCVRTRFADGLLPRIQNAVDVLIFNPPYVPTTPDEADSAQSNRDIAGAWAGGNIGIDITDKLLERLPHLLSTTGVFYLVCVKSNDPENIIRQMEQRQGLTGKIVLQRRAGREHLFILRFLHVPTLPM